MKKGWFAARLRSLMRKMTSLAFVTWAVLLAVYIANAQNIDAAFLAFTAAVIGIKSWKDIQGGGSDSGPGGGPSTPAAAGGAE